MFDARAHRIAGSRLTKKIAVLSIDVEHDYNGNGSEALNRLPDLLDAIRQVDLPLTAFVEGRLFAIRPDLCGRLAEFGADLQLHCYDHSRPGGDSADSLRRGIDAFQKFTGTRPRGYRAHTYRLTEDIFQVLVAEGFAWDSSILPGIGFGNYRGRAFRNGDWFMIDGSLAEFPVASWRAFGIPFIPFTQSYRQLMGWSAERLLDRAASLPTLLVYDMHMMDLVPDGRFDLSPLPLWMKSLHALVRARQRGFGDLAALGERLRAQGYEWSTLSRCCEQWVEKGR